MPPTPDKMSNPDDADKRASLLHRMLNRSVPSPAADETEVEVVDAIPQLDEEDNCSSRQEMRAQNLLDLPPDATATILSHLHPHDLFNFSSTSKRGNKSFCNELLWKSKFIARWNCPDFHVQADLETKNALSKNGDFWRHAYKSAFENTHDLWIRHWNCVYPEDVSTCHGRTVIPRIRSNAQGNKVKQCKVERSYNSSSLRLCPTCRYHPMLQNHNGYNSDVLQAVEDELEYSRTLSDQPRVVGASDEDDPVQHAEVEAAACSILNTPTAVKTIHYSTIYSVAKWCRNIRLAGANGNEATLLNDFHHQLRKNKLSPKSIQNKAIRAFECASTYNRRINTKQYSSSGLYFLTDALFFNINPSHIGKDKTSSESWRSKLLGRPVTGNSLCGSHLNELLQDLPPPHALGPDFEISHHSWHIVRLTNPDYVRPITFRTYIQCPKAFTVYPSQGYLKGGETAYLVLGVRQHGSLINESYEAINVEREEVRSIQKLATKLVKSSDVYNILSYFWSGTSSTGTYIQRKRPFAFRSTSHQVRRVCCACLLLKLFSALPCILCLLTVDLLSFIHTDTCLPHASLVCLMTLSLDLTVKLATHLRRLIRNRHLQNFILPSNIFGTMLPLNRILGASILVFT